MATLSDLAAEGQTVPDHRPCPRVVVSRATWTRISQSIGPEGWTLMGLWGDRGAVHMAVHDPASHDLAMFSLNCSDGSFPSVGQYHPAAQRLERAACDLYGFRVEQAPDSRPWIDHGRWPIRHPLGDRTAATGEPPPFTFLPVEGESLHEIPVGPVHAGIIEPGHFRFTANGETVVRLEERLGYVHKGLESLMSGADIARGAQLASRLSGDSMAACSWAFARAVEAALIAEVPPRALWLRGLMAELERLANHLGDIGAICNDAAFALMLAHCGVLRERVLRASDAAFGHRLMRDRIVPGGVTADLTEAGEAAIRELLRDVRERFPQLVELYDNTASLQDRTVATGILSPELAQRFGAGGYVGRASGRDFDSRRDLAYAPYDELRFTVPVLEKGDVDARVWIRIREVEQSLTLVDQILTRLPVGPVLGDLRPGVGEGMGIVEAFRGDMLAWVRLGGDGTIERCHLRDASWFQWPLLEAIIEGNIVADFPLCNKSFNCSYSGHDL